MIKKHNTTWFGRCIFLSWYCDVGTCKFCFRSTTKHKIRFKENAKRSVWSILADALIGKELGWRLEFLTGGYRIFSFDEMLEIIKYVSKIYGEKIWINLGTLDEEQMDAVKPYVEGICASIECVNPELHKQICPDKPVEPYLEMLKLAKKKGFKTSATIIIGLGEKHSDFKLLKDFISEYGLDRITFYALKPVKGTGYTKSPDADEYYWWVSETRKAFPKLEIMAGLTPKRQDYVKGLLLAGATAITKFPVVRRFNSPEAKDIEKQIKDAGFEFSSSLTKMPDVDWDSEVDKVIKDKKLAEKVKLKVKESVNRMSSK